MVNKIRSSNGNIANPGLTKGTVAIVKKLGDLDKVKKGCVIISERTIPAMIIAMEKCNGIVTDLGGVTSHAAIVSRELGIPCIVGCKNATKIFNDGDLVVLDADKGIIKKISKEVFDQIKTKIPKNTMNKGHETGNLKDLGKKNIIMLKDIGINDSHLVGGKSARLGEIFSKFNVPSGFCITSKVFKDIFNEKIIPFDGRFSSAKEYSDHMRKIILDIDLPEGLTKEIVTIFKKLRRPVAVRSSATMEDLSSLSFAGQQDTYLNIKSKTELIKAIKKCWASLFNHRAIVYREKNNIKHENALMSILVQEMVDADKSGVMFSVDPIKKSSEIIILEAIDGLGEKLVSGAINPDKYIVSRQDLRILDKDKQGNTFVLDNREIKQLAKIAHNLEQYFNEAQDIEFAVSGGEIFILQSRNITNYSLDNFRRYLNAIEYSFCDYKPDEAWPLNGAQVDAYFDIDESLEMYSILKKLRNKKSQDLVSLFPRSVVMKYAMTHNLVTGLKIANKLGFSKIPSKDILDHLLFFISIAQHKQVNDIFDNKKVILFDDKELGLILKTKFGKVKDNDVRDKLRKLITVSDALVYSLYYDIFISAGLERSGPYDVSERFGPGAKMVVFDYYDIKPSIIWEHLRKFKYKKLKVYLVFKDSDVKVDFLNRFIASQDFIDNILYYKIESRPKASINNIIRDYSLCLQEQTRYVENLSDIEKVKKGALIYHYQFKELREKILGFWKPKYIDILIKKIGDQFVERFKKPKIYEPKEYVEFYDPKSSKSF